MEASSWDRCLAKLSRNRASTKPPLDFRGLKLKLLHGLKVVWEASKQTDVWVVAPNKQGCLEANKTTPRMNRMGDYLILRTNKDRIGRPSIHPVLAHGWSRMGRYH